MANPPFDLQTLHPPFTVAQRESMIAWILLYQATSGAKITHPFTAAELQHGSDADLLTAYAMYWTLDKAGKGPITGPGAAIGGALNDTTIGQFLGNLSKGSTWVRIGEFAFGFVLVAVGVNAALKTGSSSPVRQSVKQVRKATPVGRASFLRG